MVVAGVIGMPGGDMIMTSIKLPLDLFNRLNRYISDHNRSAKQGITKAEVIREALDQYLRQRGY